MGKKMFMLTVSSNEESIHQFNCVSTYQMNPQKRSGNFTFYAANTVQCIEALTREANKDNAPSGLAVEAYFCLLLYSFITLLGWDFDMYVFRLSWGFLVESSFPGLGCSGW